MDENDGSNRWMMVLAGLRGMVNDAVAVHLRDAALAAAFVVQWCGADRAEVADGRSGFTTMRRCRARLRRGKRHLSAAGIRNPAR